MIRCKRYRQITFPCQIWISHISNKITKAICWVYHCFIESTGIINSKISLNTHRNKKQHGTTFHTPWDPSTNLNYRQPNVITSRHSMSNTMILNRLKTREDQWHTHTRTLTIYTLSVQTCQQLSPVHIQSHQSQRSMCPWLSLPLLSRVVVV